MESSLPLNVLTMLWGIITRYYISLGEKVYIEAENSIYKVIPKCLYTTEKAGLATSNISFTDKYVIGIDLYKPSRTEVYTNLYILRLTYGTNG